jgi:adenosine deaminase
MATHMTKAAPPTPETLRRAPKVLLHDHLDGGIRPETLLELARDVGYEGLPASEPVALEKVIQSEANQSNLPGYLAAFRYSMHVLQTENALTRVATECVADLAADGVVYAEVRFAPEIHTQRGLTIDKAISAVVDGLRDSIRQGIEVRLICTALRHKNESLKVAEAAVRYRDRWVVGLDLAGPEAGYPADDHTEAVTYAHRHGLGVTIHAGEAAGLPSITTALDIGAMRIGHGVRLVEDIQPLDGLPIRLGHVASRMAETGVTLEICPTSNIHTGAVESIGLHPVTTLLNAGLKVTVNTDNRRVSAVTTTSELSTLVTGQEWGWDEIETVTLNAIDAAFCDTELRQNIRRQYIEPWYHALPLATQANADGPIGRQP